MPIQFLHPYWQELQSFAQLLSAPVEVNMQGEIYTHAWILECFAQCIYKNIHFWVKMLFNYGFIRKRLENDKIIHNMLLI